MSVRCPGCPRFMGRRQIACPNCRPLIPVAIREDLVRLWFRREWWTETPLWEKTLAAARQALRDLPRPAVPPKPARRAMKCGGVPL